MLSRNAASEMIVCVLVCLMSWCTVFGQDALPVDVDRIAGIYAGQSPTERQKAAVRQLKLGMKQLYGIELKDITDPDNVAKGKALIVLGRKAGVARGLVTDEELRRVKPDGYVIKCGDGRIAIAGEDGWCSYYGSEDQCTYLQDRLPKYDL